MKTNWRISLNWEFSMIILQFNVKRAQGRSPIFDLQWLLVHFNDFYWFFTNILRQLSQESTMEILADRKTYRWVLLLKDLPICMYFYRVHYMKLKAIYNTIHVKIIFTCIWTITCISVIVVGRRATMWSHRQFRSRFEYCMCTSPPYFGSISIL